MKFHAGKDTSELVDTPGLFWLHASLFIGVGAIFVVGPLFLFPGIERVRWWLRAIISIVGAVGAMTGAWLFSQTPRSRITVRRSELRLERWGLKGHEQLQWPLAALAAIQVAEQRDSDGDPVFQIRVVLREGQAVPMSPIWHHGRERMSDLARRLAAACELPAVNAADTRPAKMNS